MANKSLRNLFFIILSVNIILVFLFLSFRLTAFSREFYRGQFEINGANKILNRAEAGRAAFNLIDFLKFKSPLNQDFFNEKEISHLEDVKSLFRLANIINWFLLILLSVNIYIFFFIFKFGLSDLKKLFILPGIIIFLILALSVLFRNYYEAFFLNFHYIFFQGDSWLFDPAADKIIVLFAEPFFYNAVKRIIYIYSFFGLILIGSGAAVALAERHSLKIIKKSGKI